MSLARAAFIATTAGARNRDRLTREKKRMTQEAVAEQAGIAVSTLSHLEAGHANPTWATVRDITAALGVTMVELARLAERHE